MRFQILTLFPEMFSPLQHGIIGKACANGLIDVSLINIRDYSLDKHGKCDDAPFGGGAGMVMTAQPLASAVRATDPKHAARRIYLSPKGRRLNGDIAKELSLCGNIMLICGAYEGVDQRFIDSEVDGELSIGDYILTGGELAAMVTVNCVSRFVKGVLGNEQSAVDESFSNGLLEYPHYTRPAVWEGLSVPDVLLSGNHAQIQKWRAASRRRHC